ncbi:MAG: Unknown protein, partial [uncultured Thiotrichaceae bacterium]
SILLIFMTALLSNVMKQRRKDRVLKEMQDFHITMQVDGDKQVWGKMQIYSNGLELQYSNMHRNSAGELTSSYIMHQDDIDRIGLFYRFHNELSLKNQARRKKEVEGTINPSIYSRTKRILRNLINAFNDAINEALGAFLSRMKGHNSAVAQQDTYLRKVGISALGLVGNVYDPIFERFINKRVVIVVQGEKDKQNYSGFLKEYSPSWLSLLDCRIRQKDTLNITDIQRVRMQRNIDIEITLLENNGKVILDVTVQNFGIHALKVIAIRDASNYYKEINRTLNREDSLSLRLDNLPDAETQQVNTDKLPMTFSMIAPERQTEQPTLDTAIYQEFLPDLTLVFYTERVADIYIPRSLGVLRNSADVEE